ncbi:uncharacterized protein [Spinacia oleracea]|uniref:Uncharacterized protein isoform X2 n=1 Tax=Spinacia oleracea TaxID=3562 RepID=A0A9R0J7D8_SPIOL|nr:uncharacterized protein LOC110801230 isoform X2 [Spinacia oleracea]
MVCSVGSVKMAVMARLSASGNISQGLAEKAGHQKLVAEYIQKELLEADDANLLVEEDMHVFDLNPLTDPLNLVCCNFCKKPVKASKFATHAELCRSLGSAEELLSELDRGTGNQKPPRKERKKSVTAEKRLTLTGVQEKLANVDASETAVSSFQLEDQGGITFSCLREAKGTIGKITGLAGETVPLIKRPKLIAADTAQPSDETRTVRGVRNITSFQDAITYVPAPLATKIYYSQRNNRLQASISHMFNRASTEKCCINERQMLGNPIILEASSLGAFSERQFDDQFQKSYAHSSPTALNANQTFRQGSAVSLVKNGPGGGEASNNFVNQFSMIDAYTSQTPADGAIAARYHPKPYPFAGDSALATIQRPTGSVPVV